MGAAHALPAVLEDLSTVLQATSDDPCLGIDPCAGFACPAPRWHAQTVISLDSDLPCSCVCRQGHLQNETGIEAPPLLLHQAWKTRRVSEMDDVLASCVRSWRTVNPRLRQELYDDARAGAFVRKHYPQYTSIYFEQLTRAVERADLFRYLVVHHFGGYWADVDTVALRPLDSLKGDLVVGREPQNTADGFGVVQYFFGATPRHAFFGDFLLPLVARRVARRRDPRQPASVLWATGPQAFTAAYKAYVRATRGDVGARASTSTSTTRLRGESSRRWDSYRHWDRRVLPMCALGAWCFDCAAHGYAPYLEHRFLGSWKGGEWSAQSNWSEHSSACAHMTRDQ